MYFLVYVNNRWSMARYVFSWCVAVNSVVAWKIKGQLDSVRSCMVVHPGPVKLSDKVIQVGWSFDELGRFSLKGSLELTALGFNYSTCQRLKQFDREPNSKNKGEAKYSVPSPELLTWIIFLIATNTRWLVSQLNLGWTLNIIEPWKAWTFKQAKLVGA